MSIYKDSRSPYWQFDFQWRGRRFFGSTKATTRREAEAVERGEREKAKRQVALREQARTSLKLDDVAGRYWQEVGQHHAGAENTWRLLTMLVERLGKDTLIADITSDDVARLVAWRRGHRTRSGSLISPFTVNDLTEQLKKLFTKAKKAWNVRFDHEPDWTHHKLKEPQERVRELVGDEAERLEAATRDDYAPFFAFAQATGFRFNDCVTLRWSEVDWNARQIRKRGKGGKWITVPITPTIREILWPLQGNHPEFVFTYVAQQTRKGRTVKGKRYPLTRSGTKTRWRRQRTEAGVVDFRFHDFRHDLGTKLLRETGNLKLVQRTLNHSDLKTTTRYAHVLDEDVAEGLERIAESRTKPRSGLREVD